MAGRPGGRPRVASRYHGAMSSLLGTVWHVAQCRHRRAVAAAGGEGMACRPGTVAVCTVTTAGVDPGPVARLVKAMPGEAPPT